MKFIRIKDNKVFDTQKIQKRKIIKNPIYFKKDKCVSSFLEFYLEREKTLKKDKP